MFRQMFEEKYMRFPEGKSRAFTVSYDDGVRADKKLLALMARYGINGTFNINSKLFDCECWHDRMNEQETYGAFVNSGQEIALHGARHIFMDKVPLAEAIKEVVDNRSYLEQKFERIVRGMAYAYNGYNSAIKDALKSLGVAYARTTNDTYGFKIPTDWLELNPTCHHRSERLSEVADRFFSGSPEEISKHREPWLFYLWGHSYEFDDDDNWNVIEDIFKRVSADKNIWLATNMEVYEYVQAYNALVFSIDGERVFNPSAKDVWLEIRGKVYKIESGKTILFDID